MKKKKRSSKGDSSFKPGYLEQQRIIFLSFEIEIRMRNLELSCVQIQVDKMECYCAGGKLDDLLSAHHKIENSITRLTKEKHKKIYLIVSLRDTGAFKLKLQRPRLGDPILCTSSTK